jgi:hypothetical protein
MHTRKPRSLSLGSSVRVKLRHLALVGGSGGGGS